MLSDYYVLQEVADDYDCGGGYEEYDDSYDDYDYKEEKKICQEL